MARMKSTPPIGRVRGMIKGLHEFKVKGYSLVKGIGVGKFIASEKFNVGGYDWVIYFYPDGKDSREHAAVYVSIFVMLLSNAKNVHAMFELAMHDQRGQGQDYVLGHFNDSLETDSRVLSGGQMWGIKCFYKRLHLEHSAYLLDDCLQIDCTIGVSPITIDNSMIIMVPESTMTSNFEMMFQDKQSSDVTFCVRGNKFYAHKIVLAARSTVFKTQLFTGTEKVDGEILVNDMEPKIFKALLYFIYNDTLTTELYLSVPPSMSSPSQTNAAKLLVAAHKYDLPRLKLMCQSILCHQVSIDTVAEILVLSDCCDANELKSLCLQFSTKHLKNVVKTAGFEHIKKNRTLQFELLKTIAAGVECAKSCDDVDTDGTHEPNEIEAETHEPNEIEAESTSYNPSSDEENHMQG